MARKRVNTIAEVARAAGVSTGTVSRVLNGKNKNQWASTARRAKEIRRIAEELNYRPSWAAKSMFRKRSQQIGVVLRNAPDSPFQHPQTFEMIMGINDGLDQAGYVICLVRLADVVRDEERRSPIFRERMLDGLISVGDLPHTDTGAILQQIQRMAPWSLSVDGELWQEAGCLRRDEVHAGATVVEKLREKGYRRCMWLGPPPDPSRHYSVGERYRGVVEAAQRSNLSLEHIERSSKGLWLTESTFQDAFKQVMNPQLGVIAYDVHHALGIVGLAAQHGWKVGSDFGLACCDDDMLTLPGVMPQLSRMSYDRYEIGKQAAEMIVETIESGKPVPSARMRGEWQPGHTAPGPKR